MSKTSTFGTKDREGHDSSSYYDRKMSGSKRPKVNKRKLAPVNLVGWADTLYCHSSISLDPVPDESVALAFTSPPYNCGKDYDLDLSLAEYLAFINRVGQEVYRVLIPGGRYVINVANLGRKPYIPLVSHFYSVHTELSFIPRGEIVWRKGKGAGGNCAWGSWMSASNPCLRDVHEYLLVFSKECFGRIDKGVSDIGRDEFMEATLSVWEIPPESAKRIGHPAPFPVDLAYRVIKLYTYKNDVVLDPFVGSGTTCVAAKIAGRHWVGFDNVPEYIELARDRLAGQLWHE